MSSRVPVWLLCATVFFSTFSYAAVSDRIQGPLSGGAKVALRANGRALARPGFNIGRMDGNRLVEGVALDFRPSAAQQKDLDIFISELGDPSSPNYHKYLTPKQFGERFGLSWNDIRKVTAWLQAEGFTNVRVSNGRNRITFDGTVAQIESTFNTEFHHYLVDGELNFANATDISVPVAMAEAVIGMANVSTFRPKPRARPVEHFTSSASGNHFLSPGDFAKIYNLQPLYDAGADGTGQTIAVVGQTALITADIDHFRSASGLSPKNLTETLVPNTGTSAVVTSDLVESDLDVEWSGGVAKNANINFVYVGNNQNKSVWDSLQYAVTNNVAPFITTSYGFCEQGLEQQVPGFSTTVQGWAKEALTHGQTIVAASGDAGAADCEPADSTDATTGLAVDVPASIPEVTGMGGNEFFGDASSTSDTTYWLGATSGDTISSAKTYIPEEGWNDTTQGSQFSASGGGASTLFAKPSWQTGTGVPNDGKRDVPDVSLSASPGHDGYLFCSQTVPGDGLPSCTSGFRDSQGNLDVVGGTSAGSPTFAAILALINQYSGNSGVAPINPTLYSLAASTPAAFHDVTTGNNIVPCTAPSTNCPTGTTQIGFSAGTGYDQVTGLGSVNGFNLAQAMSTAPGFSLAAVPATFQVAQGSTVTATVKLTAFNGFTGQITYTCTDKISESTCTGPSTPVDSSQSASFTITTKAPTARLERPFDRGARIFYATLFPGLMGIVFVAGSRKHGARSVRMLGLILTLGVSTLWLGSCGGSSNSTRDPGTPAGTYSVTVTGTATVNNASVIRQAIIQIVVIP